MKVFVKNKGEINLTKANFLSSGGEGEIYTKNGLVYKIYLDHKKTIPVGKIKELSHINNTNVIKPIDIISNGKINIGYTMRYVNGTYALCQLFTKAFRNRENISHDKILNLIKNFRGLIDDIHKAGVLVVDLNELNFLVSNNFQEIYAIDTDSYQTKNYPATAIMDSIRDRHSNIFNENTDWFSFGILVFQMLISIHPYKGKHNKFKTLEDRMINNISVLNKDVTIPKVCYPFDIIPEVYKNWFKAIFDEGKRIPPPVGFDNIVTIIPVLKKIVGSNNFDIQNIFEASDDIVDLFFDSGSRIVLTKTGLHTVYKNYSFKNYNYKITQIDRQSDIVLAYQKNGKLNLTHVDTQKEIQCNLSCSNIMNYKGILYLKNNDKILELHIIQTNKNILVSAKTVANILEHATSSFDGVFVQNLLGACYTSFFPRAGLHIQTHVKELDAYKIIEAKFDGGVLMVIGIRAGQYDKFIFRFSDDWKNYDIRKVENINNSGINFVVLDNGICVHMNDKENLELFSSKKDSSSIKEIEDDVLHGGMKLFAHGSKTIFSEGSKLYSITMKANK